MAELILTIEEQKQSLIELIDEKVLENYEQVVDGWLDNEGV